MNKNIMFTNYEIVGVADIDEVLLEVEEGFEPIYNKDEQ